MEQISIFEAQKNTSPNSLVLISTIDEKGKTNLATVSWWTFLSNRPPIIGFSLSKKGYSGQLINITKKVIVSIPSIELIEVVEKCGKCSGREVDKINEFNIEVTGDDIKYPIHSKLVFFCSLLDVVDAGDHLFYKCFVDDILYNALKKQLYAWDGYKKISPLVFDLIKFPKEDIYMGFFNMFFYSSDNRYVYSANDVEQRNYFKGLLLNQNDELKLHFTYLPRKVGLKALANNEVVIFQRGILTFTLKDGICHVTSQLPVSSQGVPTEYRGFAIITNPNSTGPACTCFLKEINNSFGIFILFSFRLSATDDFEKHKTRISECMAVRKVDGTSFVYRLLLTENYISDEDMRYFEGFLKVGSDGSSDVNNDLSIMIRMKYILAAEKFFSGQMDEISQKEKVIYDDLEQVFEHANKTYYSKLLDNIIESGKIYDNILVIKKINAFSNSKQDLLLMGWLRKYSLTSRHDKVEKILDDYVEEVHRCVYPELHSEEFDIEEFRNDVDNSSQCAIKKRVISFIANELLSDNVIKYNQNEQMNLKEFGIECSNCITKKENCKVLKFYNASDEERRNILK